MNVSITSIFLSTGLILMVGGCGHYSISKQGAMTDSNKITKGSVMTTSAGTERNYAITGDASMIRSSMKTIVDLNVGGLHASEQYPSHVHNLPCEEKGGGGHYQHDTGGKVDAINEIWLTFTANDAGVGSKEASHGNTARPDAQSIVIHDSTSDKARIGCINLTKSVETDSAYY